ncbi:MAG: hypothetical protein HY824_17290 [Acidobacteria bacterium]|nr:hypothetical protein [Acidobacteriota bacterium]
MKHALAVAATAAGLATALLMPLGAQPQAPQDDRVRSIPAGRPGPIATDPKIINLPAPRLADGRPDLTGPWVGGGSDADIEREGGLKPGELPLLPWARELRATREKRTYDEPYIYCLPMSVPRVNPYPWKFSMSYTSKGLTSIYVLHETGDAGAHRVVYMDGRTHPDADHLFPTWWGHSIGRWDRDTLVIDTVGYNDKFWFDARGTPHTEQLHTIERWTRVNNGTLVDEFTLDDPGALARPVQLKFTAALAAPGIDLMEYICTENNQLGIAGGYRLNTDGKLEK